MSDRILRLPTVIARTARSFDDSFERKKAEWWVAGDLKRKKRAYIEKVRLLPKDQLRGLQDAEKAVGAGVHFLWKGPQLYYVGKAADVHDRLVKHRRSKRFSRGTFLPVWTLQNREVESAYARHYLPPGNETRYG